MCLIITGTSAKVRSTLLETPKLLGEIYASNKDGVGMMYVTKDGLRVRKALPKTLDDVVTFIQKMPIDDRNMALHFRQRTHGDISIAQCHPYPVAEGIAMMHNGILHTDNHSDKTKSDTWHFVKDYLTSLSADALHDAGFQSMMGEFIDSNRFVIMSADGRMTITNKEQGIEHDGLWFANTYAWNPETLIPTYKPKYSFSKYSYPKSGGYSSYTGLTGKDPLDWPPAMGANYDWADEYEVEDETPVNTVEDAVFDAVMDCDADTLAYVIEQHPRQAIEAMMDCFVFEDYHNVSDIDLTDDMCRLRQDLVDGKTSALMNRIANDTHGVAADNIAQCVCWYCTTDEMREYA